MRSSSKSVMMIDNCHKKNHYHDDDRHPRFCNPPYSSNLALSFYPSPHLLGKDQSHKMYLSSVFCWIFWTLWPVKNIFGWFFAWPSHKIILNVRRTIIIITMGIFILIILRSFILIILILWELIIIISIVIQGLLHPGNARSQMTLDT